MFDQYLTISVCLCCLLLPVAGYSQQIEEPNSEALKTTARQTSNRPGPELSAVVKQIVAKTNAFRQQENRPSLMVNPKLVEAAEYFAKYMAHTNKYGHQADGNQPADRVKKYGYEYCIVAENIAYEYDSSGFTTDELAEKFFEGWKNSPGHRKNMLDPDVTETGVAVAQSESSHYYYAVQVFGRPKSMSIAFELTNDADTTAKYELDGQSFTLPPNYTRTHERCRPGGLTVKFGGEKQAASLRPANGDHFVITGQNGSYQVKETRESR